MNFQRGLSLIEMMVALAVLGILVAAALPAFGDLVKSNRIATQANSIVATMQYARNEAVNRSLSTRVEPIVAGTDWSRGWLVRVDGNNDNDFVDTEDIVIRNYDGIKAGTLTATAATTIFNPAGSVDATNTFTLRATECDGEFQRIINVLISGLVSLSNNKNC